MNGLLGLARRAGAVVPGVEAVREAIRGGEARVVLFASDAATGQLAKVRRTSATRSVPLATHGDRAGLGSAVGLPPLSALAVTSATLAERILAELAEGVGPTGGRVEAAVAAAEE